MYELYIGLKAQILSHISYWDLQRWCNAIGSALITNDQLWKHCLGFKSGHSNKPSHMTYCQYYMRLLKTGTCYRYEYGQATFFRDHVYSINILFNHNYYIDKQGDLRLWDGQEESLVMTGVANCIALQQCIYILAFDGKLYKCSKSDIFEQIKYDHVMSLIHEDIKSITYDDQLEDIWLRTKDGIMQVGGESRQNVKFMLKLWICGYDNYVYLYLYSNSNLTLESHDIQVKEDFLFSGVAFVVKWFDYFAIVTTKDELKIYTHSMFQTTTKDPIFTVPDVQKIHHATYTRHLLVLKTNGKLYYLLDHDDNDMELVYISDNVVDMYANHFICAGS